VRNDDRMPEQKQKIVEGIITSVPVSNPWLADNIRYQLRRKEAV